MTALEIVNEIYRESRLAFVDVEAVSVVDDDDGWDLNIIWRLGERRSGAVMGISRSVSPDLIASGIRKSVEEARRELVETSLNDG